MNPCEMFGHNWVVLPRGGRLVELCPTCGALAEPIDPEQE